MRVVDGVEYADQLNAYKQISTSLCCLQKLSGIYLIITVPLPWLVALWPTVFVPDE